MVKGYIRPTESITFKALEVDADSFKWAVKAGEVVPAFLDDSQITICHQGLPYTTNVLRNVEFFESREALRERLFTERLFMAEAIDKSEYIKVNINSRGDFTKWFCFGKDWYSPSSFLIPFKKLAPKEDIARELDYLHFIQRQAFLASQYALSVGKPLVYNKDFCSEIHYRNFPKTIKKKIVNREINILDDNQLLQAFLTMC